MSLKLFYTHLLQTFRTFLITFVLVLGFQFGYFYYIQIFFEKQAHPWLDRTLLELLTDWDQQQFLAHGGRQLIANMTQAQGDSTQRTFDKLGELFKYHGSEGQVVQYGLLLQTTRIRYQAHADFKRGAIFAVFTLVKEAEQWKIEQFYYEYAFYPQRKQLDSLKLT